MPAKQVFVFPGFMDSNMGILSTGEVVWWDNAVSTIIGIGAMRLAPDGVSPGPPDGQQLGVDLNSRWPWPSVVGELQRTLAPFGDWTVKVVTYDWRLKIETTATTLANAIIAGASPDNPVSLVGHSMGGLVCVLAYAILASQAKQNLVRRIVTLCSPFQGSYLTTAFLAGETHPAVQLLGIGGLNAFSPLVIPALWTLEFINGVVATWPAFYELMPSLLGAEAASDPNRKLLYTAANYPGTVHLSQTWLDYAKNTWQPLVFGDSFTPPPYVLSCVSGVNLATPNAYGSDAVPIQFAQLQTTTSGDGVVTAASAYRAAGKQVTIAGYHTNIPLAMAYDGSLAALIADPRGPLSPPPPPLMIENPALINTNDPPIGGPLDPTQCVGGHC